MPTTPNMGLTYPTVSVTPGPDWATLLNAAIVALDAHTHAPGAGPRVPTAGLNVNADLPLNDYRLTGVKSLTISGVSVYASPRSLSTDGTDLWFVDGASNLIRLTVGGGLNIAGANITSDFNLNGYRLMSPGSIVPVNNGGAIALALSFYVEANVLKWNDHNSVALRLAADRAVDPPVVTTVTGATALAFSSNPQIVRVRTSLGAYTVTLPPPSTQKKPITIVDVDGNSGTNNITIARNAGENICGVAASLVRRAAFGGITLMSDGTNWDVL